MRLQFNLTLLLSLLGVTSNAATLFDSSGFEAPIYALGVLDGQNAWISDGSSTEGIVQSAVVSSGSQAILVSGGTTAWQFPKLEYTPLPGEIIRISFDVRRSAFTSVNNLGYFVDVYNTAAGVFGRIARTGLDCTGTPSAPGRVQGSVTIGGASPGRYLIGSPLLNDTWYTFVMELNFASNTYSVSINGSTVACELPFVTPSTGIGDADLQVSATAGSTDKGYFDNYLVEALVIPEPAIICPPDKVLTCGDSTDTNNTGTATSTGHFSSPVTITHSDVATAPQCAGLAGIDRTWKARDACGIERSCVQHITFADTNAPVITCPANKALICGDSTATNNTGMATATDSCSGLASISFSDAQTNGSSGYIIARTWAATDNCGNTATCVQTITVTDTRGPVVTCPPGVTNNCSAGTATNVTGVATATDDCSGVASITCQDARPGPGCAGSYLIARTWTARDNAGNSSSCIQNITVSDTTPPVITCSSNLTLSCASLVPAPDTNTVTAHDGCGGAVTITFVGDSVALSNCLNRYTITRTYRATDECGNSDICAQTITVNDTNGPTISCPSNLTVSCSSAVPLPDTNSVTASDGCGGTVTITFVGDSVTLSNCANQYTIIRTFRATDLCGNSATCTTTINVLNDIAPTLHGAPTTNLVLACGQPFPSLPIVTATAGCDAAPLAVNFDSVTNAPNGLLAGYFITNCWTATDSCSNSVQACQLVTFLTCRASLCVVKFDDVNTDGLQNNGEAGITNWQIRVTSTNGYNQTNYTSGSSGSTCFENLDAGTYTVTEGTSKVSSWFTTGPKSLTVVMQGSPRTVKFGNVCIGAGGASGTPSFWSSKDGQNLMGDAPNGITPELTLLSSLCLRTASGANFDPKNSGVLKDWFQPASSPNAAYMLSVQLACMELNVESARMSGASLIYAPGTTSANAAGFASVNAVMIEANALLCRKGNIPAGDPDRPYAAALNDALTKGNLSTNFVQPRPCALSF